MNSIQRAEQNNPLKVSEHIRMSELHFLHTGNATAFLARALVGYAKRAHHHEQHDNRPER
jgi:hypothetical protein